MKIIVVSTLYPNSQIYSSGIFVHEQVKELLKLDVDINVIAPVPFIPLLISWLSERWKLIRKIPSFEKIDNVKIYHPRYLAFPKGYLRNFWSYTLYWGMKATIKQISNIDIIHAHGSAPEDYGAYLLSNKYKVPFILTVHGDSVYELYKRKKRFRNSKKAIEKAHMVVGVSSNVIDRVKLLTLRQNNLQVILNGFTQSETSKGINLEKHKGINILFVATLVERKGCKYLIEAFSKLYNQYPYVYLTIAGGGKLFQEMKNYSKQIGLNDRINFTGVINHYKVMELMSECDIFAMPSWDEAFGVVYLEAMSLKKPIIACKNEGITDVVNDGVEGMLVTPRDSNSIYEKLIILIENEKLRNDMGERGYQKIKNLTWKNNALKILEVYNNIMNNS